MNKKQYLLRLDEIQTTIRTKMQKLKQAHLQQQPQPIAYKYIQFQPKRYCISTQTQNPTNQQSPQQQLQSKKSHKEAIQKLNQQMMQRIKECLQAQSNERAAKLQKQKIQLIEQIKRLQMVNQHLTEQLQNSSSNKKPITITAGVAASGGDKASPSHKSNPNSNNNSNNKNAVNMLTQQNKKLTKQIANLQKGIQQFHQQCKRLTTQLNDKDIQLQRHQRKMQEIIQKQRQGSRILHAMSEEQEKLAKQLKDCERRLKYKNSRCSYLQDVVDRLYKKVEEKDQDIQRLRYKIEVLNDDLLDKQREYWVVERFLDKMKDVCNKSVLMMHVNGSTQSSSSPSTSSSPTQPSPNPTPKPTNHQSTTTTTQISQIINLKLTQKITQTVQKILEKQQKHHQLKYTMLEKLKLQDQLLQRQKHRFQIEEIKRFNDFTKRYLENKLNQEVLKERQYCSQRTNEIEYKYLLKVEELEQELEEMLEERQLLLEQQQQRQQQQQHNQQPKQQQKEISSQYVDTALILQQNQDLQTRLNEAYKKLEKVQSTFNQDNQKHTRINIQTPTSVSTIRNFNKTKSFKGQQQSQQQIQIQFLSQKLTSAQNRIQQLQTLNEFKEKQVEMFKNRMSQYRGQRSHRNLSPNANSTRLPSFGREYLGDEDLNINNIRQRERDGVSSTNTPTFQRSSGVEQNVRESAHFQNGDVKIDEKRSSSEPRQFPPPKPQNAEGIALKKIQERVSQQKVSQELRLSQMSRQRHSRFDPHRPPSGQERHSHKGKVTSPNKKTPKKHQRERSDCLHKANQKPTKNSRLRNENKIISERNKSLAQELQKTTQYILMLHNLGTGWKKQQKEKEKLQNFESIPKLHEKLNEVIIKHNKLFQKQQQHSSDSSSASVANSRAQIIQISQELQKIINQTSLWVNIFQKISKAEMQRHDKMLSKLKLNKNAQSNSKQAANKFKQDKQEENSEQDKRFQYEKEKTVYSEGDSPKDLADIDHIQLSPFEMEAPQKPHIHIHHRLRHNDNGVADDVESLGRLFKEGKEISEISSVKNQSQVSDFFNSRSELGNIFDPKSVNKLTHEEDIHPIAASAYHDVQFNSHFNSAYQTTQNQGTRNKQKTKNILLEDHSIKSLRNICSREKQKVKMLEKKISEMNLSYKKIFDKIQDQNKKIIQKFQKDFNTTVSTIIKAKVQNQQKNNHNHQNHNKNVQQQQQQNIANDASPIRALERLSKNITRSMSQMNLQNKINEKDQIIQEKIQQLQNKVESQDKQLQLLNKNLREITETNVDIEKKLRQEKYLSDKLEKNIQSEKDKKNALKLQNKRLKNQFNQFMDKLSYKGQSLADKKVEFKKKASLDSFAKASKVYQQEQPLYQTTSHSQQPSDVNKITASPIIKPSNRNSLKISVPQTKNVQNVNTNTNNTNTNTNTHPHQQFPPPSPSNKQKSQLSALKQTPTPTPTLTTTVNKNQQTKSSPSTTNVSKAQQIDEFLQLTTDLIKFINLHNLTKNQIVNIQPNHHSNQQTTKTTTISSSSSSSSSSTSNSLKIKTLQQITNLKPIFIEVLTNCVQNISLLKKLKKQQQNYQNDKNTLEQKLSTLISKSQQQQQTNNHKQQQLIIIKLKNQLKTQKQKTQEKNHIVQKLQRQLEQSQSHIEQLNTALIRSNKDQNKLICQLYQQQQKKQNMQNVQLQNKIIKLTQNCEVYEERLENLIIDLETNKNVIEDLEESLGGKQAIIGSLQCKIKVLQEEKKRMNCQNINNNRNDENNVKEMEQSQSDKKIVCVDDNPNPNSNPNNNHKKSKRKSSPLKRKSTGSLGTDGGQNFYQFQQKKQFNNVVETQKRQEQKDAKIQQLILEVQTYKQKLEKLQKQMQKLQKQMQKRKLPSSGKKGKLVFLDR